MSHIIAITSQDRPRACLTDRISGAGVLRRAVAARQPRHDALDGQPHVNTDTRSTK